MHFLGYFAGILLFYGLLSRLALLPRRKNMTTRRVWIIHACFFIVIFSLYSQALSRNGWALTDDLVVPGYLGAILAWFAFDFWRARALGRQRVLVAPAIDPVVDVQSHWHYLRDGVTHGPVTAAEIGRRVASGAIKGSDLVWRPGFGQWTPPIVEVDDWRRPPPAPIRPAAIPEPPSGTRAPPADNRRVRGQKRKFFARHWRGEFSLPLSYWAINLLTTIAVAHCAIGLASIDVPEPPTLS